MPAQADIERLRSIKRLDQLIAYLRDELDWPIQSDDIEYISYTYEPEELGLDAEHAVKINQIRQIRPLHSGQPWGIFWVSFEKKRCPSSCSAASSPALLSKASRARTTPTARAGA